MRFFLAVLVVASLAWVRPASACGGFFCQQVPMNQAGERIAFVAGVDAEGNDTVEAHVQITYSGAADAFAWVVPVPAMPELSVGSMALFNWLSVSTQPQFNLEYDGSSCGNWMWRDTDMAAGGPPTAEEDGGGVQIISQMDVGPYDATILRATDATAMTTWLRDHDYDLTDAGAAGLVPYLGDKYWFVALKLQAGLEVGDLKPLVVKYRGDTPCVPIKLTAIAANPDMPITAFVFAPHRAVPLNYRHVLINEARIDWLNFGSNYTQVATAAVDEAGGRAFLTEYAGPVEPLRTGFGWLMPNASGFDTAALARLTDPVAFWEAVIAQNFPRDGLLAMARRYIPKPASLAEVSEQDFYNRIGSFREAIASDPDRVAFDPAAFAHELEESIVAPLRRAQEIASTQPYLTRLFTTMSAHEMTEDPDFHFNGELGDVSNVHTAQAKCDGLAADAPVRITLANGQQFWVERGQVPDQAGPAAERIEQLAKAGQPAVILDNRPVIEAAVGGCGGCDAGTASAPAALLALALLRRRRARNHR